MFFTNAANGLNGFSVVRICLRCQNIAPIIIIQTIAATTIPTPINTYVCTGVFEGDPEPSALHFPSIQ